MTRSFSVLDVQINERNLEEILITNALNIKFYILLQTRCFIEVEKKSLDINRINVKSISQINWFGHKNVAASLHPQFIFVLYFSL